VWWCIMYHTHTVMMHVWWCIMYHTHTVMMHVWWCIMYHTHTVMMHVWWCIMYVPMMHVPWCAYDACLPWCMYLQVPACRQKKKKMEKKIARLCLSDGSCAILGRTEPPKDVCACACVCVCLCVCVCVCVFVCDTGSHRAAQGWRNRTLIGHELLMCSKVGFDKHGIGPIIRTNGTIF